MREILFRGKRTDNGEWVYGYVGVFKGITQIFVPFTEEEEKENEGHIFSCIGGLWYTVNPETIGQFTGLTDKNGKKIFEGDIVCEEFCGKKIGVVTFGMGTFDSGIYKYNGWHIRDRHGDVDHNELFIYDDVKLEAIGNIHDNFDHCENAEITHWMPLPEPPRGE